MKKVFAVFLAICILASLGISAFADAADYPWGASGSESVSVVISDGLVNVPAAPFAGMKNITSVTLPASVVNIEGDAFGDSAIAEVRTAGDPEVLEGVKAFENAEIIQISQDEFDAAVKAITDNPTEVGEKGSYILSGTSLLIRLIEKRTVPAASFWLYEDEGSAGGTSESGSLSNEVFDKLGRLVSGTYYYSDVTMHVENTYNSDDPNDNDYSGTQKITWEETNGDHSTQTTTYNENGNRTEVTQTWNNKDGSSGHYTAKFDDDGNPTEAEEFVSINNTDGSHMEQTTTFENGQMAERTTTMESPDGDSSKSTTKYNKDGNPTETTSSLTNSDGTSGKGTKQYKYDDDGNLTEYTESWTSPDGRSGESTRKYENGNLTEESTSLTDEDGNTVQSKHEYKYNADASQRKVTYSDSNSTKDQVWWEKLNDNGEYITDESINSPE